MSFQVIELKQGSKEWHDWRREGIGASDAATIMGENPWKTKEELFDEKIFGKKNRPNYAMQRGIDLEPEARKLFEYKNGVKVYPVCLQSDKYNWLRASVDGLSANHDRVVEIKCGKKVYEFSLKNKKAPDYNYAQLQHILAITNLPAIDFFCYLPGMPEIHLQIKRNEGYISDLLEAEYKFWQIKNELQDFYMEEEII